MINGTQFITALGAEGKIIGDHFSSYPVMIHPR